MSLLTDTRHNILRDIDALSRITVSSAAERMGIVDTYMSLVGRCRVYLEAEEEAEGRAAVRAIAMGLNEVFR